MPGEDDFGPGSLERGLWLVATPIGNLEDLSPRAARVLRGADEICCEDTRRTGALLRSIGAFREGLIVANEHTEADLVERVVRAVAAGRSVVLVSDAGTPAISDPGRRLVEAVCAADLPVHCVPGPSAFVMAAVLSGLPTDRLVFEGFLPRGGPERRARINELVRHTATTVLYEAPHRLARTVADLREACGDQRRLAISREMTKVFEETWRGTLGEAVLRVADVEPRGEHVIVLAGAPADEPAVDDQRVLDEIAKCRDQGMSTRDTVDHVAARLGAARNRVYDLTVNAPQR